MTWTTRAGNEQANITCPLCGLACDDLRLERDGAAAEPTLVNGCSAARARFGAALGSVDADRSWTPLIRGQQAALAEAIEEALNLLQGARSPLIGGLATDVNGMRAVLDLADRCGATLDHAGGDALFRNVLVVQDAGWMTCTLTEVRNRADLVVVLGTECHTRFPRLFDRVLAPAEAMFTDPAARRFVLVGPWADVARPTELSGRPTEVIDLPLNGIGGLLGLVRGHLAKRPVRLDAIPGISPRQIEDLATRLRDARYAVVVWAAGELAFSHAELMVQTAVELVRDLNETTRAGALPLAGTLGDVTTNQVCTWQTGYPLRTGLQRGGPHYDPVLNRHADLIARDECDLLVWIDAFGQTRLPATDRPTLVLGHPSLQPDRTPEVFIPVGTPGIDHPGHWYRTDAVCPLPLGQVRDAGLPSVAQVLSQLSERLALAI